MVATLEEAVYLVEAICALPRNGRLVSRMRRWARQSGTPAAVAARDTAALFDWLMNGLSLQGISDEIAFGYIAKHGNATWQGIEEATTRTRCACPKLADFHTYTACGYRKAARTCARPQHLRLCPVRQLPLRKGGLNVQALSLYFFLRDICGGDLVEFIDHEIASAKAEAGEGDWIAMARGRLVDGLSRVHGISAKLANLMLSNLLVGARTGDPDWLAVGGSMITADTLIHKMLDRTGILAALGADHAYGTACYGQNGCEAVIRRLAAHIDHRRFDPLAVQPFPIFLQKALWHFCAAGELDVCNVAHVGRTGGCNVARMCPASPWCAQGDHR